MKYVFRFAFTLLALLTLAGCASSSGTVENASQLAISKSLSLDCILVETSSSVGDLKIEKRALEDSIISGLNDTGLFKTVSTNKTDAGSSSGISIRADIKEIKKVSDNARIWVGAWAGRARVLVHVTISDLNSGKPVETFEAEGQSGKSAWAGTTDEAIHLSATQIVAEVVKINAQTSQ